VGSRVGPCPARRNPWEKKRTISGRMLEKEGSHIGAERLRAGGVEGGKSPPNSGHYFATSLGLRKKNCITRKFSARLDAVPTAEGGKTRSANPKHQIRSLTDTQRRTTVTQENGGQKCATGFAKRSAGPRGENPGSGKIESVPGHRTARMSWGLC